MITENKSFNSWFRKVIIILIIVSGVYVSLHFIHKGEVYNKLTRSDITSVNLLLNNNINTSTDTTVVKIQSETDSLKIKTPRKNKSTDKKPKLVKSGENIQFDSLKNLAIIFILKKCPPVNPHDSISTANYLKSFDKMTFPVMVDQYNFKSKSFFWLTDSWVYLEILFWSFLGLICSFLYNVSESLLAKKEGFKECEIPMHWAKLVYTPFVALIIYLAIDLLTMDKDVNVSQYGNGLIVFSFILGFFSRRAIDLLEKIKDIILPGKDRDSKLGAESTEGTTTPKQ